MKINVSPVKGTYDYAPKQAELRENVRGIILNCYKKNGFSLISTPILESLDLLDGSEGGDNLHLIFKTVKRGDKLDLTIPNLSVKDITEEGLRYDLTVPLSRFYAGKRESLPCPFKAIQMDYSFRAEKPQKGRNRQFIQCDIDIFGDKSINAEIDVLTTGVSAYKELGFDDLTIKINNREILDSIIKFSGFEINDTESVCISLDKLDKIGVDGVKEDLLNKGFNLDKINVLINAINAVSQSGIDSLTNYGVGAEIIDNMKKIIKVVSSTMPENYKCVYDISIVRGQGYYTGTIYEVYTTGFRGAIGGGGRYDKMINKIIGIDVPAVGFSMGFEPICMLLEEKGKTLKDREKIAIIYDEGVDIEKAYSMKAKLIKDFDVSIYLKPKNLKNLLDKLKNINYDGFVMLKNDDIEPEIKRI